jgi:4-amino-4-deoxy-L-arabinose transferase-like glycosyltransferase
VLVRLPFLFNTGVDEAFYLVVGRQWLEGMMPPYAYFKPPLLFALMAAAEAAFGPSLLAAKALAMASVSATAYALFLFGGRFLSERAGVTAALLYILSSLSLGGAFSPAELILAPFAAFGMLLGSSAALGRRRPSIWPLLAAGFCLGAAASVKQIAIFEAAPLATILFFGRPPTGGRRERCSAAAAPPLSARASHQGHRVV